LERKSYIEFQRRWGATGLCGGTPHSCGSEPAQYTILPDKSGVPAETMWLDFLQCQDAQRRVNPAAGRRPAGWIP